MTAGDVLAVVLHFDVPWNLSKLQHTQKCRGVICPAHWLQRQMAGPRPPWARRSAPGQSGRPFLRTAAGSPSQVPPHPGDAWLGDKRLCCLRLKEAYRSPPLTSYPPMLASGGRNHLPHPQSWGWSCRRRPWRAGGTQAELHSAPFRPGDQPVHALWPPWSGQRRSRQEGELMRRLPRPDESPPGLASWTGLPVSPGSSGQRAELGLLAPSPGHLESLLERAGLRRVALSRRRGTPRLGCPHAS